MNVFYLYTSVFSLIKKDSIKLPGWVSSGTFKILGALYLEEEKKLKNRSSNSKKNLGSLTYPTKGPMAAVA